MVFLRCHRATPDAAPEPFQLAFNDLNLSHHPEITSRKQLSFLETPTACPKLHSGLPWISRTQPKPETLVMLIESTQGLSLGENAPLDPATPSNDYLAASGSSPPPNSPSVSSRSQESLLLSSPLGVLDNLGRGRVSQSPRNLSNAAFSPLDSGSISDTQDRPSVPSVSNSLQSNSPGLPKPTFTPKFSPGSIGLCTPRYLLSQQKPGTIFIPDPSPIPPGRNITLKLPPWRQDYCIDNDGWLWDFDRYSPPPRPNAQFLGGDEERQYWANLLEDEDLPPAPALDHDLEADDEDLDNPDNVHYGIEPEPDDPDSEPEPDPNPEPQPQINQDEHDGMDIDIGDEDPPDKPEDDDAAPAFHGPANLRNYYV
ncbi:hypothetical protein RhiJN_09047 [Ceratobasidium sp. AG-Ba]|nr:hypothetical protein RhiJN_09047 [Ceratobasidium sp. AG-Ba]